MIPRLRPSLLAFRSRVKVPVMPSVRPGALATSRPVPAALAPPRPGPAAFLRGFSLSSFHRSIEAHSAEWKALLLSAAGDQGDFIPGQRALDFLRRYGELSWEEKKRVLEMIGDELAPNQAELEAAAKRFLDPSLGSHTAAHEEAQETLRDKLEPPHEKLFANIASLEGGMQKLIELRADVLKACAESKESVPLASLRHSLTRLFQSWFSLAFLTLKRITFKSSASLLKKIMAYSATIHHMESWEAVEYRLGAGRRCYAFFHSSMPEEPLVFIECALRDKIEREILPLTQKNASKVPLIPDEQATTAIFYAIISTQPGLAGVDLGHILITRVYQELHRELPNIKVFSTLSPLPLFRNWLTQAFASPSIASSLLLPSERDALLKLPESSKSDPLHAFKALIEREDFPSLPSSTLSILSPILVRLAARFVIKEKKNSFAFDPVANFHLRNGAIFHQLNFLGNPTKKGLKESYGLMVNYIYDPHRLDENNALYLKQKKIVASPELESLANRNA